VSKSGAVVRFAASLDLTSASRAGVVASFRASASYSSGLGAAVAALLWKTP
jgi:hypothetical protein